MRKNFIQYLLFAFIVAFTTACSDNGDDIVAPGNGSFMPITDWTATDSSIKASQRIYGKRECHDVVYVWQRRHFGGVVCDN